MERRQKIAKLFTQVLEKKSGEQTAFLKAECEADSELQKEIEELLAAYREASSNDFLGVSALELGARFLAEDEEIHSHIGKIFGHYKIIERIGDGGMGAIYLAARTDDFEKRVAVKIIKRGMDTEAILRRFRNERQILATLEHPNIARLIDGGTTDDGLPYLVMEFVAGLPVDEYCRKRNLSLTDRLELFRKICAAVSYAHRNLVIHRDLKPSNILVDDSGEPKLLDFGIAKIFSNAGEQTQTQAEMRVFTPEYASPEQLCGDPLTTATDVYSLGVIIYELLTGAHPFKVGRKNFAEVLRIISETEPASPSEASRSFQEDKPQNTDFKLRKTTDKPRESPTDEQKAENQSENRKFADFDPKVLKGDLDNIILKALRKEPERRYSSVENFSDDVRRYMEGLPVSARRGTFSYRAEKFIQRNRTTVIAASLLIVALLGGVAATVWQWRIAGAERAKAEARFESLRKSSRSMVSEIHGAMMNLNGSLEARKLLLQRAVEQLDTLAADAGDNKQLQLDLADAYQNIGYLPDKPIEERTEIFNKSIGFYEKVLAVDAKNIEARKGLALGKVNLADFARLRSENDEALKYNREAIALLESVVADEPANLEHKSDLWNVYYNAALTLTQIGHAADALDICRRMIPVADELKEKNPASRDENVFRRTYLGRALAGGNLIYLGRYDEALKEINSALEENEKTRQLFPDAMFERLDQSVFNYRRAIALERGGAGEQAIEAMKESIDEIEALAKSDSKDLMYQTSTAQSNSNFGHLLLRSGKFEVAVPYFKRAIEVDEKAVAADAQQKQAKADLAYAYEGLGEALAQTGNITEGLMYQRKAVAFYEEVSAANSSNAVLLHDYADTLMKTGETYLLEGKAKSPGEARRFFEQSLAVWAKMNERGVLSAIDADKPARLQNLIRQSSTAS